MYELRSGFKKEYPEPSELMTEEGKNLEQEQSHFENSSKYHLLPQGKPQIKLQNLSRICQEVAIWPMTNFRGPELPF